ncbi:histidinol-phosphate transaminase [Reinekea marina]|uniref:Histidinol-phosphate aminotransferase n=1 Tax=Reinekea marina TaxID=1310421 RepID=A0ABV7WP43_9GAMM|nr:histidinol-phosphate transaminase [Reinekea marina]MDN3648740.1 histidinol-phosphate transaminase [Reinekea marina]
MAKLWSPLVENLEPYVPGEQPKVKNLIKLNTNENPYPPSPKVNEVVSEDEIAALRLYPDPDSSRLKQTIASYHGIQKDQVFVGNGSDEVLAHSFVAFFKQGSAIQFPKVSYSFYPVYANLFEIETNTKGLKKDFSVDVDAFTQPNGGVIFPNPNAPTGICLPLSDIRRLLAENTESVVIIDEAYIDFGGESAVSLIDEFKNLLVIQTLSKSRSLAGLRIGFAMGNANLIEALDRVKNSFNSYPLDRLAEVAAVASFEDETYFKSCCDSIIDTREWTVEQLLNKGFDVLPSKTNFVFAKPNHDSAKNVFNRLRSNDVLVRYFDKPGLNDYLRISIGTPKEMETFIQVLNAL